MYLYTYICKYIYIYLPVSLSSVVIGKQNPATQLRANGCVRSKGKGFAPSFHSLTHFKNMWVDHGRPHILSSIFLPTFIYFHLHRRRHGKCPRKLMEGGRRGRGCGVFGHLRFSILNIEIFLCYNSLS